MIIIIPNISGSIIPYNHQPTRLLNTAHFSSSQTLSLPDIETPSAIHFHGFSITPTWRVEWSPTYNKSINPRVPLLLQGTSKQISSAAFFGFSGFLNHPFYQISKTPKPSIFMGFLVSTPPFLHPPQHDGLGVRVAPGGSCSRACCSGSARSAKNRRAERRGAVRTPRWKWRKLGTWGCQPISWWFLGDFMVISWWLLGINRWIWINVVQTMPFLLPMTGEW